MDRVLYDVSNADEQVFLMDDSIFYKQSDAENDGYIIPINDISLVDNNKKTGTITISYFDKSTATHDDENITISSLNEIQQVEFGNILAEQMERFGFTSATFVETNSTGLITQFLFFAAFGIWCYFNWDIRLIIILSVLLFFWIGYRIWIYLKKPICHRLFYKDLANLPANMKKNRAPKKETE